MKHKLVDSHPDLTPMFFGLSSKLSRLITSLRMEKGMTQSELSKAVGVDIKIIYKIEGGSSDIPIGTYEQILLELGLSYKEMDELIKIQ
jgi:transcriptional regulator with XRE-family HTH domain